MRGCQVFCGKNKVIKNRMLRESNEHKAGEVKSGRRIFSLLFSHRQAVSKPVEFIHVLYMSHLLI